jgi:hypothetical protein
MHIRCFAHVINLIVQAFLAGMDEAEDPDTFDWFEVNKGAAVLYDPASDEDQLAMEAEELEEGSQLNPMALDVDVAANEKGEAEKLAAQELAVIETDELEQLTGQSPIKRVSHTSIIHQLSTYSCHIQLRFITTKIVSSPQRHTQFKKHARDRYSKDPETQRLVGLMVVQDVRTRWNYTHAMIRRALLLRKVCFRDFPLYYS